MVNFSFTEFLASEFNFIFMFVINVLILLSRVTFSHFFSSSDEELRPPCNDKNKNMYRKFGQGGFFLF